MIKKIADILVEKKRRIGMSAFGVIICAISVGIFKIAALGVDPSMVVRVAYLL